LDLDLPKEVIQSEINAYAVCLSGDTLRVERPDPDRRIFSIFRGGGPRLAEGDTLSSFDHFLLTQARERGATHIPLRVHKITWDGLPVIHTADGRIPADLLVLATGVNSRAPLSADFGYQRPKTAVMAQDEVLRPSGWPEDQVTAFFQKPPGLIFGALIPKGKYLNVSLLGKGLATDAVTEFFEAQPLNAFIGEAPASLCGCTPRIAIQPAKNYFGNRWVAVGDAAATRLYKDGIGSAFFTAQAAMQTAVQAGITRHAFRSQYESFCREVVSDNAYCRLLFRLWSLTLRNRLLLRGWRNAIRMEQEWPPHRRIHVRILWGMFTGDEPYRDLFWLSVSPAALATLWVGIRNR
jgi:flavin-dependent dehydrogenase